MSLLQQCQTLDVDLFPCGDSIDVEGPREALTTDFLEVLKLHKPALLRHLEFFEERAAMREFHGGLSRRDAEEGAAVDLFNADWLHANGGRQEV